MNNTGFYLITDASVLCSYLTTLWAERFENHPDFRGIVVREKRPHETQLQARHSFHTQYAGKKHLSESLWKTLTELYSPISQGEQATIQSFTKRYGFSAYAVSHHPSTIFLDHNVNSDKSRKWLHSVLETNNSPWFFSCIGQIFRSDWVEYTTGRLINTHSAVLPYARGIYTIENLAATQDIATFQQGVGFTVHYIDAQVDTGEIIRAERIQDPFQFDTLWDLKSHVYMTSFRRYVDTAEAMIRHPESTPAGIMPNPVLRGRNFKSKDFSEEKQHQAEQGYLAMKAQVLATK